MQRTVFACVASERYDTPQTLAFVCVRARGSQLTTNRCNAVFQAPTRAYQYTRKTPSIRFTGTTAPGTWRTRAWWFSTIRQRAPTGRQSRHWRGGGSSRTVPHGHQHPLSQQSGSDR